MSFSASTPKSPVVKAKETAPLFILQGGVKLKGRPVSGATLTLTKNGKTVAKMYTPKNGLYYFQMDRTMTDPQSEYILNILKEGVASGIIRINTYTPKEQFTAIPYTFNLDIALTSPVNSGSISRKDFGRIKWLAEKNVFDFDKAYIPVDEEKIKADSIKLAEKVKEEKELKRQADSIAEAWAVAAEAESVKKKAAKAAAEKERELKEKNAAEAAKIAASKTSKTKNKQTGTDPLKAGSAASKEKNKSTGEAGTTSVAGISEKTKSAFNNKTEPAKNNNVDKGGLTTAATTGERINAVKNGNSVRNNNAGSDITKNGSAASSELTKNNSSVADSIREARNPKKDLFFLTGVPMEQFKTNLPAGETYSKNADGYNAEEELIANSERNRLLAATQRYERKKAENFAKKQETNNALTSLIDAVEEYSKIKKEAKH